MKYVMFNKNTPILICDIVQDKNFEESLYIRKIEEIIDKDYLPVGVRIDKDGIDRSSLNSWLKNRKIPSSRQNIDQILNNLNIQSTEELILENYGLSLSDQYWLKPVDEKVEWKDINNFENDFSDDIGKGITGINDLLEPISLKTPDNTSDGWLKKSWKIINGERYLLKAGSQPFKQEPFNEVLGFELADCLGLDCVKYVIFNVKGEEVSACKNFITPNTELVPAWQLIKNTNKPNHISSYDWYLGICKNLGIKDIEEKTNDMLVLDYLLGNTDRHYNNFGLIRDVETLEFIGVAPIFDSGTSMYYNKLESQIDIRGNVLSKPFRNTHPEQIKLVKHFDKYDFSVLKNIDKFITSLYKRSETLKNYANRDKRINLLEKSVKERVKELEQLKERRNRNRSTSKNEIDLEL